MPGYTVLTCPICRKSRWYEGATPSDRLVKSAATHVFEAHPATPPSEAQEAIERAVDGVEVVERDASAVETGRWIRPE